MKRTHLFLISAGSLILLLVSWGDTAHRVMTQIAEDHLTRYARLQVHRILGNESMADAATWADSAMREYAYKHTAAWHYIQLPPGLEDDNELRFVLEQQQKKGDGDNIYTAILTQEAILKDSTNTASERAVALKFLINLMEDAHDPSHIIISDSEFYTNRLLPHKINPNLSSFWNSDHLLDQAGKSYGQVADTINKIVPDMSLGNSGGISVIDWLWDTYQLNLKINKERQRNGENVESYYRSHTDLINTRLKQAGLRLATVLNNIFQEPYNPIHNRALMPETVNYRYKDPNPPKDVTGKDAASRIGDLAIFINRVYGHKTVGKIVLLYVGDNYPDQFFTVILKGVSRSFEGNIDGRKISVVGNLIKYKGKPAIVVESPYAMKVYDEKGKVINR